MLVGKWKKEGESGQHEKEDLLEHIFGVYVGLFLCWFMVLCSSMV